MSIVNSTINVNGADFDTEGAGENPINSAGSRNSAQTA
jgi:hypothetical protein